MDTLNLCRLAHALLRLAHAPSTGPSEVNTRSDYGTIPKDYVSHNSVSESQPPDLISESLLAGSHTLGLLLGGLLLGVLGAHLPAAVARGADLTEGEESLGVPIAAVQSRCVFFTPRLKPLPVPGEMTDVPNTCSTLARPTPSIHLFEMARTRFLTTEPNFFLSLASSRNSIPTHSDCSSMLLRMPCPFVKHGLNMPQ